MASKWILQIGQEKEVVHQSPLQMLLVNGVLWEVVVGEYLGIVMVNILQFNFKAETYNSVPNTTF
jgi:hypothetical protein